MGTPNNELLAQLRGAIQSWTAEVGAAQQGLSQQIDGANGQLSRLLAVLQERQQLTSALAAASEELERLKQAMRQDQLPAGAVTRYTVAPAPAAQGPAADAALRELDRTIDRLQTAVESWTSQVSRSQGGLFEQFATANRQLAQLLEILAEPGAATAPAHPDPVALADPALLEELEQLRHENRILSSEVHALNVEMETFRLEQESFASANLAAETERVIKQRRDVERLEKALSGRETELKDQRQDFELLAREAETLRAEVARLRISEERLQAAAGLQHQETVQHLTALGALTREMEALRRAFLGEDVQLAAPEGDHVEVDASAGESEALAEAEARIATLEAKLTQLELEREEVAVLEERIDTLKEELAVLERRPALDVFDELKDRADSLEMALAAAPRAEAMAALQEEIEHLRAAQSELSETAASGERARAALETRIAELESELAELTSRPTSDALAASVEKASALELRIAELESELAELTSRPTADALAASVEKASALESRVAELESELAVLSSRPTVEALAASVEKASALESRIAELESELAALSSRPTAEALAAITERAANLESQIAELQEQVAILSQRPATEELAAQRERAATLETALEHLRADSHAAAEMAVEATALREQLAMMQSLMEELDGRPEPGELDDARDRIAALEDEVHSLKKRIAAAGEFQVEAFSTERAGLQAALAAMEVELATMKRREEETMATARTLLVEMETHRTYEAAQATALSLARNESVRLQDALTERQQQIAALGAALAAADAAREELAAAAAQADANRVNDAELAALRAKVARLETEQVELEAAAQQREARIAVLEADLPGHAESLMKATALEEALHSARARADELEALALEAEAEERSNDAAVAATLADREALIQHQAAELQRFRDTQQTAENLIANLEKQREETAREHAESLIKATALEEALHSARARADELEALALEAEAAERSRDAAMAATLADREALIQHQAAELQKFSDTQQAAENLIANLEIQREETAREHANLKSHLAELSARYETFAAELEKLRAQEASCKDTIAEAQAEASAVRAVAAGHEEALASLTAELDEKQSALEILISEKAVLSEESQSRQNEIRETMAQMSQVLHERDELSEELEAEKSRRERVFAGTAGAGKNAAEALESRDERARQQEILLSELAQPGLSRNLGDILVNAGILTRAQLSAALDEQQKDPTQLLGTILIERDYTTDDAIAQAVACQLEKPVVNPMEVHIQKNALDALHRDLCTWHVCIPLRITPDRLVVAMANPLDESAIMKLRDISQREITPVVGTPSHIMGAIDNYYGTF